MKHLTLVLLACFIFPLSSLGQEFGAVGSEWHYTDVESITRPNSQYSHFKSVKDTTIQGKTAHKIAWNKVTAYDTISQEPLYVFQGNDTLFMYSEMRSRFITFFIFNRNPGDTLTLDVPDQLYSTDTPYFDTIHKEVIDSVKQDTIDGIPLKKYHTSKIYHDTTTSLTAFFSGPVMERIGGLGYFLPQVTPHLPGLPGPIRCYSDSEIDHNFTDTNCAYLNALKFGSVGSHWYYSEKREISGPPNTQYAHFRSIKDTTIQGKTAHKITSKKINAYDTIVKDPFYVFQENDTVFMYSEMRSRFITFFTFNQQPGDTLTLDVPDRLYLAVDSNMATTHKEVIDSITRDNISIFSLKKYHLSMVSPDSPSMTVHFGTFMDRIGGLNYFLPQITPSIPEMPGPIRCYVDQEIFKKFSDSSCTYLRTASLPEINEDQDLTIYPNPAQDHITIETKHRVEKLTLRDMQGKRLKISESTKMNLPGIEPGLYVLTIRLHSGAIVNKKVVKASGGSPSR